MVGRNCAFDSGRKTVQGPPMPDTKSPPAEPEESQAGTPAQVSTAKSGATVTPVVAMTFVIVILLTILVVMRFNPWGESAEVAKLKQELAAVSRQGAPSVALPGGSEQIQDIAARLKKDADTMVLLSDRYQQLVDDTHAEMLRKNADLVRSEEARKRESDNYYNLRKELENAKGAAYEAESLRREVADLKATRDAQAKELDALKQQLAGVGEMASKDDFADLQRRFEETRRAKDFFESRVRELEAELSKQRLFARSENELLPAAVELFRRLRKLENQSDLEITKAYSAIGVEIGARVVKTMNFVTGSAKMNASDEEPVRQTLAEVADGDMLLVVGYASETGNVDHNRTLSSDRATGVAELLTASKRPGQQVQAVYLGQTDRFGSRFPERNQCCELWHIKGKPN
jgi:outer membrane protein OmpA-like peptidoglycan-associated protein